MAGFGFGYLAAGAGKGVAGEYLKQRDEQRAADFQEIRDRRLDEIKRGQMGYEQELRTTEAIRSEGVASKEAETERQFRSGESEKERKSREKMKREEIKAKGPPTNTTAGGSQSHYWDEASGTWKLYASPDKQFSPSEMQKAEGTMYRMNADGSKGTATTWEEIQDQYLNDPDIFEDVEIPGEFPGETVKIKRRKADAPGITDYANRHLWEGSRLRTDTQAELRRDPDRMWEFAQRQPEFKQEGGRQRAIESIKKLHKWWDGPDGSGDPLDNPTTPSPTPPAANPAAGPGQAGYLNQATNAAPAAAPPAPQGQMVESSQEIQAQIDQIKAAIMSAQGRLGDPSRVQGLQQQLQQYEMLLERALREEASRPQPQARGPASIAGNRPQQPATQVAMN